MVLSRRYVSQEVKLTSKLSNDWGKFLKELNIENQGGGKGSFSAVCSELLACDDIDTFIELLDAPDFLFNSKNDYATEVRLVF
jgi:hypothetical protein